MVMGITTYPLRQYPTNPYSWIIFLTSIIPIILSGYLFITTRWFNTFKNKDRLPSRYLFILTALISSVYTFVALNFIGDGNGTAVSDCFAIYIPTVLSSISTCMFFKSMSEFSTRIGSQNSYGKFPNYVSNIYIVCLITLGFECSAFPFLFQLIPSKITRSICLTLMGGFGFQNDLFIVLLLIVPNFMMIYDILKSDVLALMRSKMTVLSIITVIQIIAVGLNVLVLTLFVVPEQLFDKGGSFFYSVAVRRYKPAGYFIFFFIIYIVIPSILIVDQFFLDSILGLVESEESDDGGNSVYLQVTADF